MRELVTLNPLAPTMFFPVKSQQVRVKSAARRGFTLIELLVVIAIIGLLSSIVYASLASARAKGRVAAVQGSMRSAHTAALLCMDAGTNLTAPVANGVVCVDSASKYGALPNTSWIYASTNLDVSKGTFSFSASSVTDSKTVTCTESGCTTQ